MQFSQNFAYHFNNKIIITYCVHCFATVPAGYGLCKTNKEKKNIYIFLNKIKIFFLKIKINIF